MRPKVLVEKLRTQGQRTEAGLVRDILNKQVGGVAGSEADRDVAIWYAIARLNPLSRARPLDRLGGHGAGRVVDLVARHNKRAG